VIIAGALLMTAAGTVVAQESPLPPLVNAGVLGALAVCFILGLVVPKAALDRADARADRAEARAEVMLDDYKAVVPVLQQAIGAVQAADQARQAQVQQDVTRDQRDAELRVLLGQVRDVMSRERQ
jgi:hypothetical protein